MIKMIQKTNSAYLETHTHTNRLDSPQRFVSNVLGDCCCCVPMLDATSFWNGCPTTEEFVCSVVSKERVCNSCALCISCTISHGTNQSSIHLCLVQEIQAEKKYICKGKSSGQSSVCGHAIWILARIENNNYLPAWFIFSDEATFHISSKAKWTGIVSVFGDRKIVMSFNLERERDLPI
jgi:hypothetical protein